MAKKKILKDCPLNDKKCHDCEQKKACQELVAKNKKSLLSKLREIFSDKK
jgi:hypothetical protein